VDLTMRTSFLIATITTIFLLALVGYAQWPIADIPPVEPVALLPVKKTMKPFRSDGELKSYFRQLAKKQEEDRRVLQKAQPTSVAGVAASIAEPNESVAIPKATADESI